MSSRKPTHTQFAHKKVIATIGDLIQYYNERGLTHISRIPLYSAIIEGVRLVLATVPVLDPAVIIGLRGNGLTPSKIDDFLSEPSLYGHKY
jgi:hypothetical protein